MSVEQINIDEFKDKLQNNGLTLYCLAHYLGDKLKNEAPNVLHTRESFLQKLHSYCQTDYIDEPYFMLIDEVSERINDFVDQRIAESMKIEEHFLTVYLLQFNEETDYYHFYRPMSGVLSYQAYLEYNERVRQECEIRGKRMETVDFNLEDYLVYCHQYHGGNEGLFEKNTNVVQLWAHVHENAHTKM